MGNVTVTDGVAFGLLGTGGAILGARMSLRADPDLLMALFSLLLLVVAALMWRRGLRSPRTDPIEGPGDHSWLGLRPLRVDLRRAVAVLLAATGVGWLTGFFGVGGGFAIVPALTLVLGLPLARAVGTSLLVLAITSGVGLLTRASGSVALDWPLILKFTAAAIAASLVAGRLSRHVNPAHLSHGFAVLLVAVAVYSAARSVPALL